MDNIKDDQHKANVALTLAISNRELAVSGLFTALANLINTARLTVVKKYQL